jgi:tetratricopeptide (TPR) repeat protein
MSRRNPGLQRDLVQLLESWGWSAEAETLLWQQVRENIEPVLALSRLASYYRLAGNTAQLASVFEQWLAVEPDSAAAKNNLALVNLLLRTNTATAHRLAAEVVAIIPTNNAFRSTHMFSLLQQGRIQECRAELQKITNPLSPHQALYTALTLAATGETEAARRALRQVEVVRLLPEEANLYKQLHERIQ